ncbi:hypothetical protein UY3_17224 [Chelonia mydas]|uniref:Uncharacterized protein n=1 Tax=Chelonia mydas TaxID=8469 RepID=M7AKF6_CHEMY|nr:hypothetical protein UY3_17224 [Chelonia mydas]
MTDTETAVVVTQTVKDTMKMTGCRSCGMYMILEGVPEKSSVSMKCRLIQLMKEKIRGLEMQVESLVEFTRGFKRMMEQRHEEAEGKSSDLQMEAGPKRGDCWLEPPQPFYCKYPPFMVPQGLALQQGDIRRGGDQRSGHCRAGQYPKEDAIERGAMWVPNQQSRQRFSGQEGGSPGELIGTLKNHVQEEMPLRGKTTDLGSQPMATKLAPDSSLATLLLSHKKQPSSQGILNTEAKHI